MDNKLEIIYELNDYLTKLRLGVQTSFEYFQFDKMALGAEKLAFCIEGIQWTIEAMVLTKDFHNEEVDINNLNSILNEIVEAFSNEDYVLIGDLLEYEISPILEQWQILVNNVVEKRK